MPQTQPVIKRRKIETVFLGAIGQVCDSLPRNDVKTDKNFSLASVQQTAETDFSTFFGKQTPTQEILNNENSINRLSNIASSSGGKIIASFDNNTRLSTFDLSGEFSMDSDFFAINKAKSIAAPGNEVLIPKITESSKIALRSLPLEAKFKHADKQSAVLLDFLPTLKKEISIQLKKHNNCIVTSIHALNQCYTNSSDADEKGLLRCGKISGKSEGSGNCWEIFVKSSVLLLQADHNWTVASCENCDMVVISTKTGRTRHIFRIDHPVCILFIYENICLVILSNADILTWNLEIGKIIVKKSLACLLRKTGNQISEYGVSDSGIPMILLNNEECVVYSKRMDSWINVNTGIGALSIFIAPMKFIALIVPNGLIALLTKQKPIEKEKWNLNPETNAICEENQLEALLEACRALDSCVEFRFIFNIYVQKLIVREKYEKLMEMLSDFKRFFQNAQFATLIEDIKPILSEHGTSYEKLLAESRENHLNLSFID